MKEIEHILRAKKSAINRLEVPVELEMRLRKALDNRNWNRRKKNNWKLKLAATFIVVSLIGYNFNALAFYGKKLIGYDQMMNGTLSQLNELGEGQVIGKSYSLKKGVTVTLSGIMLDQNQLLAFYTVDDSSGNVDNVNLEPWMFLKGMFSEYRIKSGYGKMNDEKTEMKYIASFETPHFYEKTLSLNFGMVENGVRETGVITFKLDRNKAMGYSLKKSLNRTVKVDETEISFKSILASPTKTVIEGSIQNIIELALDQLKGERIRPDHLDVKLIADDKVISQQGAGLSSGLDGITFYQDFDALPIDLKKLQIELISIAADHDVNQQVELRRNVPDRAIDILGQKIKINTLYEANGDTYITITTEDSVILTRVNLIMDGRQVDLRETNTDTYEKKADGTVNHTRTLHFPGTAKELQLNIQRMKYSKTINQFINIPVD